MKKLIAAYILGILSFVMAMTGIFSLFFSVPGFILGVMSLREKEKKIGIPIGYQGTVGRKKVIARPFVTTKYLSFIAIGLSVFSMVVALFATSVLLSLFAVGTWQTGASEQKGVSLVSSLPEVREFKKAVEEGGRSKFGIAVDHGPSEDEPYYTIQVFEFFPDHRTTFGWFRYDPRSGDVYRQNIALDSWELAE